MGLFNYLKKSYTRTLERNKEVGLESKRLFEEKIKMSNNENELIIKKINDTKQEISKEIEFVNKFILENKINDKINLKVKYPRFDETFKTDNGDLYIGKLKQYLIEVKKFRVYLESGDFSEGKKNIETSVSNKEENVKGKDLIDINKKYFGEKEISNIVKNKNKLNDRQDKIGNFLKGKMKVGLADLFMYFNPNYPNYMIYMEDFLRESGYKNKPSNIVDYSRSIEYSTFKRNCIEMRNNRTLDFRKFDCDLNLSALEIFVGINDVDKIVIRESQLLGRNGKWNKETIAMLIKYNDIDLKIISDL